MTTPIIWKGNYNFRLSGSGLHEDTLQIRSNYRKQEGMLKLVLPTLCITYADAEFQDAVGGEQENFPASRAYGHTYFDPPIEIIGPEKIERFTYIRGAQRVEIGPEKSVIEFNSWKDLVIPRLRLDQKKPAEAVLEVPNTQIAVSDPLKISIMQYADGRHVGGVQMEKRHPKWEPAAKKEVYNLWIRVIDGLNMNPLPEVVVQIYHWDPTVETPYGHGGFRLDDQKYTDGNGCVQISNRPSGELEAYVVKRQDSRAVVRCLRPLAGQNVRLHMRVWPMKKERKRGTLTYYNAIYYLEPWDTLDWVAKTFGYRDAKRLAHVNGYADVSELEKHPGIKLPDWHFFYAGEKFTLENFDAMFRLPKGSSVTVGKTFHPDKRLPYPGEVVAVPDLVFAENMKRNP